MARKKAASDKSNPAQFLPYVVVLALMVPGSTLGQHLLETKLIEGQLLPKFLWICGMLTLTFPLLHGLIKKSAQPVIDLADALFLGFFAWSFASAFWAIDRPDAIFEALKVWMAYGVFFSVRHLLRQYPEQTTRAIMLATTVTAAIISMALIKELAVIARDQGIDSNTVYLINGFSAHKNLVASFLMLLLPLQLITFLKLKGGLRIGGLVLTIALVIFIVILRGRAVFGGIALGTLVAGGLLLAQRAKLSAKLIGMSCWALGGVAAALLLGMVAVPGAFMKLEGTAFADAASGVERMYLWDKSAQLARENLVSGVGAGNWKYAYPQMGLDGLTRAEVHDHMFLRAHNDFLSILSELGILGVLLFYGLLVLLMRSGLRMALQADASQQANAHIAIILIGSVVAYVTMSLLDFPRERIEHQLLLGITLGWLAWLGRNHFPQLNGLHHLKPLPVVIAGTCISLFCVYVGYQRFEGEVVSSKILAAEKTGDYQQILRLSQQGHSMWYDITPMGSPLKLYEGFSNLMLEQNEKGVKNLKLAVEVSPYNKRILNNLGVAYLRTNQLEEAEVCFKKSLEISPIHHDSNHNLAFILHQQGRSEEAFTYESRLPDDDQRKQSLMPQIEAAIQQNQ